MTESLYRYVLDHTREPPVLAELREETHRLNGSGCDRRQRRSTPGRPMFARRM